MNNVDLVNVFTYEEQGGNPCPVVTCADGMSSADMQDVARRFGRESGFVFSPKSGDYDFSFRFFVPNHEMEMCGHATIGALWVLMRQGRLPAETVRIETRSGPVTGFVTLGSDGQPVVEITQPAGKVVPLSRDEEAEVLSVLGIGREALAPLPVHNAVTSRVKTLIPINDRLRLNKLVTSASDVEAVCRRIGSTGLYPYSSSTQRPEHSKPGNFLAPPAIPKTQRPESQRLRWSSDYCSG